MSGAPVALAQTSAPADPAWSADGRLDETDARDGDERPYDDHLVGLAPGQRYRLSLTSEDFDPVVQLYRPGESEAIAENDDGEGFNPRLFFTAGADGDYVVRVLGFSADAAGAYKLRIEPVPPLPPVIAAAPVGSETTTWRVYTGDLPAGGAEEANVHDYSLSLDAGTEALIRVDSEAFDPLVQVYRAGERDGEPLASDDDSGGGFDPLLLFRPEEAGDYLVRVTSFNGGEGGSYRLRIGR